MDWNQEFAFLQGKTVMVTGATGLLGSNLTHALMSIEDVTVIAISRSLKKLQECFNRYDYHKGFMQFEHDVVNEFKLDIPPIDYLFHAAGSQERSVILNYPMQVINANIQGTIHCLDFLKNQQDKSGHAGRLILFSSVTIYGNNTNHDLEVSEQDTCLTNSLESLGAPYSASKRLSEVICHSYFKEHLIDYVIARLSTIYGDTLQKTNTAFFEFISNAIQGNNLTVNADNLPRRDNLFIDDAVAGLLMIASMGKVGEAYNISSNGDLGNYIAVDEIAKIISEQANKIFGTNIILEINTQSKRLSGLRLNNAKLKKLGWMVRTDIADGIKKTLLQATDSQIK